MLPISKVIALTKALQQVFHSQGTTIKEMSVVATPWETAFDLIGLTAYLTLMTGRLPDSQLFMVAREGPQLR